MQIKEENVSTCIFFGIGLRGCFEISVFDISVCYNRPKQPVGRNLCPHLLVQLPSVK